MVAGELGGGRQTRLFAVTRDEVLIETEGGEPLWQPRYYSARLDERSSGIFDRATGDFVAWCEHDEVDDRIMQLVGRSER